ncbi:MAG TPA: alanine racemase [Candidatus Dormibacteraeota bacterium]|nr:alanine racemase [Candidatus Dormibacteraeota bacterium]
MNETSTLLSRAWIEGEYRIDDLSGVMTPALAIYPEIVRSNIDFTLQLLGADPARWRPHVKTAKLESVMRILVERGVKQFKCATTLELLTACHAGASDILVAYPMTGANAIRARQIAAECPRVQISALVETPAQIANWKGSRVALFVDINPGMNRTGIEQSQFEEILAVVNAIRASGLTFSGLHYYDGHLHTPDLQQRITEAHRGYDRLIEIVRRLESSGSPVAEVITSGTPAFPATVSYPAFTNASFVHRASPGTVVYGDVSSVGELPSDYRYRPAAIVLSRVVSHPRAGMITCDAGHKTLSVDAGVPNCVVLGHPEFRCCRPSEEHLPMEVSSGIPQPAIGNILYLVPRHVCPTVNNFDHALFVRNGRIESVELVSARGREAPFAGVTAARAS